MTGAVPIPQLHPSFADEFGDVAQTNASAPSGALPSPGLASPPSPEDPDDPDEPSGDPPSDDEAVVPPPQPIAAASAAATRTTAATSFGDETTFSGYHARRGFARMDPR